MRLKVTDGKTNHCCALRYLVNADMCIFRSIRGIVIFPKYRFNKSQPDEQVNQFEAYEN